MGESVAHLCSLAFDIASCSNEQEISQIALEGTNMRSACSGSAVSSV